VWLRNVRPMRGNRDNLNRILEPTEAHLGGGESMTEQSTKGGGMLERHSRWGRRKDEKKELYGFGILHHP